jgi:hypothetical protein
MPLIFSVAYVGSTCFKTPRNQVDRTLFFTPISSLSSFDKEYIKRFLASVLRFPSLAHVKEPQGRQKTGWSTASSN